MSESGANSIAPYSRFDRALHNLAFNSSVLQDVLTDIEAGLYAKSWQHIAARKPIFVTSLPRAGTTIILEALYRLPGLATHTYRDMPFVLTPVLWSKLSGRIRKKSIHRERAHGDGLVVSEDSPEAFEEVIWKKFFPEYYSDRGINLWSATNIDFTNYFHQHMRKIILLRNLHSNNGRYVSKNNGNIARISTIKTEFPDAFVLVPIRDPIEQAISLWRQHRNFLEQHAVDDFVKKYMADLGHYEFGELHLPIRFPGLKELVAGMYPDSLSYWIAYWIAAFEYMADQDGIIFVSYEKLCLSPLHGLESICRQLDIQANSEEIAAVAKIFKKPPPSRKNEHGGDQLLMKRADKVYKQLLSRCLH